MTFNYRGMHDKKVLPWTPPFVNVQLSWGDPNIPKMYGFWNLFGFRSNFQISNSNFKFQFFYCHRITKFPNKLYNSSVSCDNEDWAHKRSLCTCNYTSGSQPSFQHFPLQPLKDHCFPPTRSLDSSKGTKSEFLLNITVHILFRNIITEELKHICHICQNYIHKIAGSIVFF